MAQSDLYSKGQIDKSYIAHDGKVVWLRKTVKKAPFAIDTAQVSPTGSASLNNTGNQFSFPRKLDVCFALRIVASLPALTGAQLAVGSTTSYVYELTDRNDVTTDAYAVPSEIKAGWHRSLMAGWWVRWVPSVGHAMITEIRFTIASQTVTKLSGDLLNCIESTVGKNGHKQMELIGSFNSQEQAVLWASNAQTMYIDVPLWFTAGPEVALILAALSLNTVQIEFDTRAITDLIQVSNPDVNALSGGNALTNTSVTFKMTFLGAQVSANERKVYLNHGAQTDVMMSDWQTHTFSSSDTVFNKAIPFVGPIQMMFWTTILQNKLDTKDFFEYSSYISQEGTSATTTASTTAGELVPALIPMKDMSGNFLLDQLVNTYTSLVTDISTLKKYNSTDGNYDVTVVSKSPDIYKDWRIDANGQTRHQQMNSDFFRTATYLDYGYAAPQSCIYMASFSADPFSTEYHGAMNVSKMDHMYLVGNVQSTLDNGTSGAAIGSHKVNVHGRGANFFSYKGGGGGKLFQ